MAAARTPGASAALGRGNGEWPYFVPCSVMSKMLSTKTLKKSLKKFIIFFWQVTWGINFLGAFTATAK